MSKSKEKQESRAMANVGYMELLTVLRPKNLNKLFNKLNKNFIYYNFNVKIVLISRNLAAPQPLK